jgi:hypothetical protein
MQSEVRSMPMYEEEIAVRLRALPEALKREVLDYTDFLLSKQKKEKAKKEKFNFSWEDGLSDIESDVSSVELQHRAFEWR